MSALQTAIDSAYALQRTPLVLDATGNGAGITPLETFYSYSGHQLLELKKMVVEVNMKKSVRLDDALEAARAKLVLALRRGYSLVMLMSNSAPPLRSQFCTPGKLPFALLDQRAVQAMRGLDGDLRGSFVAPLLRTEESDLLFAHKDFNVVLVSAFARDEYEEFLRDELPLAQMQPIHVTID
uniref:Uncharacterized protein n=1 Tax=Diacronema lutheri TaxID=2081491 RepID=A0A7R9ULB5_DIALT